MLTMATAARLVTDWAGDPGAVVEYGVRFTKPVVVPDDGARAPSRGHRRRGREGRRGAHRARGPDGDQRAATRCSAARRPSSGCPDATLRSTRPADAVLTRPAGRRGWIVRADAVAVVFVATADLADAGLAAMPGHPRDLTLEPPGLGLICSVPSRGRSRVCRLRGRRAPARPRPHGARSRAARHAGCPLVAWPVTAPSVPCRWWSPACSGSGWATRIWDVAMNVEGADVERRLGGPIMPRFHAGVQPRHGGRAPLGGAAAAALARAGARHCRCRVVVAVLGVRAPPPAGPAPAAGARTAGRSRGHDALAARDADQGARARSAAWREPPHAAHRACWCWQMALAEGTRERLARRRAGGRLRGRRRAVGAGGFGVFVAAMTLGRHAGRPAAAGALRPGARRCASARCLVLAGVLLLSPGRRRTAAAAGRRAPPAALRSCAASAACRCGAAERALGFPVGMSAAADEPARAARGSASWPRIGYIAFLAGPPLLGLPR